MDELHKAMSWEEFLRFPRKLGWKYEYYGEMMHLSPAWTAIAKLRLTLDSLPSLRERAAASPASVSIRPLTHSDWQPLLALFCECFAESIEYSGCDHPEVMRYAHQSLDRFFGSTPPTFFSACRVAVDEDRIIGGCMIERSKLGPTLQPIFVAASHRRRGIATGLLMVALQDSTMRDETELHSHCNLGNEASYAWHLRNGFIEVPCRWTAGHRANIYQQEAERQELLGLPTATTMRELADFWGEQRARLESDGRDASG